MLRALPLRSVLILLALAAVASAIVACDGEEETTPITPTATVTLTASPEGSGDATATPTGAATETPPQATSGGEPRRSGDEALDRIIAAVEARDVAALDGLVEYQMVGCTHADGLGGPPKCPEGAEEGDEFPVFPYAACEGGWSRTATQELGTFAHRTQGLWAVIRVEAYPDVDLWPAPDYFLVFHSPMAGMDVAAYLEVTDGRITRSNMVCAGGLDELLAIDIYDLEVIAGPWDEPAPVEAPVPTTGIEPLDEVLAAVASYEIGPLVESARRAMAELPPVPCEVDPLGPGAVICDMQKGEQAGDPVQVFPIAYCEGALVRDPLDAIRGFLDQAPRLYAVVEAPDEPSQSDLYRHGTYWVVYEFEAGPDQVSTAGRLQVTEDGHLTVLWYGCLPPVEELVQWEREPLPEIAVREE